MADTPVVANTSDLGGPPFAADKDAGNNYWPYAKLAFGPSGTQTEVADAAGKAVPVKVRDGLAAASVVAGQISLTGAEAALSNVVARRFKIRALLSNTDVIYVGTTGVDNTGFPLWPGDWLLDVQVSNLNILHAIVGSGTQKLAYLGEV